MFDSRSFVQVLSRATGVALLVSVLGGSLLGPEIAHAQKDYEEWKKKQQDKYQEYLNEQDKAFVKFLKKQWKNFDAEPRMGNPLQEKPTDIPAADESPPSPSPDQPAEETETGATGQESTGQQPEEKEQEDPVRQAKEARTRKSYESTATAAPAARFETLGGQQFSLSDLEGNVTLINFWATFCAPCRAEIPALNELYANLKSDGLEIVGIAVDKEGKEVVEPFTKEYNLKYPVVLDPSTSFWPKFADVEGGYTVPLPTTFVVSPEGEIVHRFQGEFPVDEMRPKIKEMLGVETESTADKSTQENQEPRETAPEEPSEQQSEAAADLSTMSFSFFGVELSVGHNPSLTPSLDGGPGKESIRSFWESMAKKDYQGTLASVQEKREELALGDWGYYIYLKSVANQLYGQDGYSSGSDAATLWTWFMMMKSGYAVRVGYQSNDVFLMLPVNGKIYNLPQDFIDGQRYYLMMGDNGGGSYRTYEGQHEQASDALDLDKGILPGIKGNTKSRTNSFSYDGERYEISYKYDTALLDYVRSYPSFELSVLFQAGVSSTAESSLKEKLRPHIEDREPRDALNFLLRFVQFVTEYEVNDEKFPEEALAGDPTDCEDRAVLFAHLVRSLLDRPLVGLDWPNHIATAVKAGNGLEATSDDKTVDVDGETYIVADPTYVKGDLGMRMSSPPLKETTPGIIKF